MYGGRWFFRPVRSDGDDKRDECVSRESKNPAEPQKEVDFHKAIWEEYFPQAFSIGISLEEFKHLTPAKLEYCLKGYKLKKKMRDEEMWAWWGNYGLSAMIVAIDRCFSGKKSKAKYIKDAILSKAFENDGLTEEEIYEKELRKALMAEEQWIIAGKQKGLPETVI